MFARGGGGGYKKVHYVIADDIFTKGVVYKGGGKTDCTGLQMFLQGCTCDGCNFEFDMRCTCWN